MNEISRLKTNQSNGKFRKQKKATEFFFCFPNKNYNIEYVSSNNTPPPSDPDTPHRGVRPTG
jgi:hypothetical protein